MACLCLALHLPVLAETPETTGEAGEITINADNVIFDRENERVQAAGSVEVKYRGVTITGNSIVYNTKLSRAWADNGFVLTYGDVTIEGRTLDYNVKTRSGTATDIDFEYQGIEMTGKRVELSLERFKLRDASFSTCNIEPPHYRVTASEIIFYPEHGWLVAYWGYFWLGPLPVVPMPTYIYDMLAAERDRRNIPPFPEFGSNDEDGTYLNERLAWHVQRELSGSYSITYATKKGLGAGIEADYIFDGDSRGNARLYYNGVDGPFGGVTHSLFFGKEIETEDKGAFAFVQLPKRKQLQLDTTLAYHERINYQRISYYPDFNFKARKLELGRDELELDLDLMAGLVAEQYNIRLARGGGQAELSWDLPESAWGDLTPALGVDGRYYSNGQSWEKTTGALRLDERWAGDVTLSIGYQHYFSINGTSPFNYELYRFRPADKLTSDLGFMVGETGVGISTSYYLDTWDPEDIDYSLLFRMHCYNLMVKYRSLRNEFELGFSLTEVK
ncbi:MAG: LPS-assembly protein LptD [Candidatus Saganbacteria bacterium]|nr:LPS-assembly protein LptD [Candidatus Saganbacteria bacterium]